MGADIANKGMVLTGGGALLRGLDQLLSEETEVLVFIAQDLLTCITKGCGVTVERLDDSARQFT